ncbi:MAG: OsmC family protein [Galactobacter sp.]
MTSPRLSPAHEFTVSVDWQGPGEHPTTEVRRFRRASVASVPTSGEVPPLRVSAARPFFGDRDAWNPETLLLAALAQCHLSAFLRQAGLAGVSVEEASVSVRAWLSVMPDGAGRLTRAELAPRSVVGADVSTTQLDQLHAEAHRQCFIANSVNFPVQVLADTGSVTTSSRS